MTLSESSAHLRRVGEMSIPSRSMSQSADSSGSSSTRLPDQLVGDDRGGGLGDRAALAMEAQVGHLAVLDENVHAELVTAEGVVVVPLEVVGFQRPEVPRVLVVVEDVVAVEGVH